MENDNPKKFDPRDNLKPWKPGQSGNPNGRPKKYTTALKEMGYKLSEINDTIQNILGMNVDELKDVWDDANATVLEKTVANALRRGIEKGSLYNLETLLSRVYGQPKQAIEHELTLQQPLFPDLNNLEAEDAEIIDEEDQDKTIG